jgi:hypothetical protein
VPLLILGVGAIARRARGPRHPILIGLVAVLTAVSLAYGVWFTMWSSAAYFSTFTRAWEFGVGALVAFLPAARSWRSMATLVGLAAIVTSAVLFSSSTPFPGTAALLPVLGTGLAIWAGRGTFLARAGAFTPVAMLGRTSYAIYLWHWPLIVLVPFATGMPLTIWQKLAIAAVALALAWLSTTFYEDPVRFSPRLLAGRRQRTVAAWTAAGMAVVLVVSVGALAVQARAQADAQATYAAAVDVVTGSTCFGAAAMDPALQPCDVPAAEVFIPSLVGLVDDDDNRPECWSSVRSAEFNVCTLGPADHTKHLLVIGDSHSNTLLGAYERIADERGWRIDVAGHAGCYLTTVQLNAPDATVQAACDTWRASALELVRTSTEIDALVVTRSSVATLAIPTLEGETGDAAQVRGMREAWAQRGSERIPVIVIRDNPAMPTTTHACLEQHGPALAAQCGQPRDEVLRADLQADAAAQSPNAHVVDLSHLYCGADACEPVVGGTVVYRPDGNHLTATFARTLAPFLGEGIAGVLAAG